jgi:hypothetical protein
MQSSIKESNIMAKFTIEVADEMLVGKGPRDKSWRATHLVPVKDLPVHIVEKLLSYGILQKLADAASQSQNENEALAAMQKASDAMLRGEWSSRGSAIASDPETVALVRLVARALNKDQKKAWNELSSADQIAKANEYREAFAGEIPAEIERMEADAKRKADEAKRNAELAKKVSIKL